jgi:ATP/maltotriose-dependent transcriptional regulator MalT
LRANELAIVVRDPKAQAQSASTVAQAHLTLGDTQAAIQWVEDCLTIARGTYPYLEAEALITLATAQYAAGDAKGALQAAEEAASIAGSCGYRLLEKQATAVPLRS